MTQSAIQTRPWFMCQTRLAAEKWYGHCSIALLLMMWGCSYISILVYMYMYTSTICKYTELTNLNLTLRGKYTTANLSSVTRIIYHGEVACTPNLIGASIWHASSVVRTWKWRINIMFRWVLKAQCNVITDHGKLPSSHMYLNFTILCTQFSPIWMTNRNILRSQTKFGSFGW